jgi:hypothetical protein
MVNDKFGYYNTRIIERHDSIHDLTMSWAEHISFNMSLTWNKEDDAIMASLYDEALAHKMFDL